MLNKVDHIVLVVPNLSQGIAYLQDLTGVLCTTGGKHPQFGTHNALLKIGKEIYLEVLAPDPSNPKTEKRWMGVDLIQEPRITRLALKSRNIDQEAALLAAHKTGHGKIQKGKRQKPDGTLLEWMLTCPLATPEIEALPFLIDWGNSAHPVTGMKADCNLKDITLFSPESSSIQDLYGQLGQSITVFSGTENKIQLTLETPKGILTLE